MRRGVGGDAMLLDPSRIVVLTLIGALAGCNSGKSTQSTSPGAMGSTAIMLPKEARPTPNVSVQFKAPREERTRAYAVTWSVSTEAAAKGSDERVLKLEYQVKAFEELYVADRLYRDPDRFRVPDPFAVYRYVQDGSLRLVFAPAPLPAGMMVAIPSDLPLYSRILPGETREQTVRIKLPIDEYPSEWPKFGGVVADAPTVSEEVSRVYFVLGYRLRSTLDHAPAAPAKAKEAGYLVKRPDLIILAMDVDKLPVTRHTGNMARFPLPGEPGPNPTPVGAP
jgi:hypothetical protein